RYQSQRPDLAGISEAAVVRAAGNRKSRMEKQRRRQFHRWLRLVPPYGRHRQVRPALPAKREMEWPTIDPRKVGRTGNKQTGAERQGIPHQNRRGLAARL